MSAPPPEQPQDSDGAGRALVGGGTVVGVHRSGIDASVNFVHDADGTGLIEARFVRRDADYFIAYLSSQTGCDKACRMCHLTQTGQTRGVDVTGMGLLAQAREVLAHYDAEHAAHAPARRVHFNFMARGEVFANRHMLTSGDTILSGLEQLATTRGLAPSYRLSTIMPVELADLDFTDIFTRHQPDLYWSLYSVDDDVRRRWLPRALGVEQSLAKLVTWQQATAKIPTLHWAFIAGVNDSPRDVDAIITRVNAAGLRVNVNIVRYNPPSERQGQEPSETVIEAHARALHDGFTGARVRVVPRVGFDVAASCGMFVGGRPAR